MKHRTDTSIGSRIAMTLAALLLLLAPGCNLYFGFFTFDYGRSHASIAEEYREEGKLQEAINEYEQHIQNRLRDPNRPSDENPYFYQLLIGDIYLELKDAEKARQAYERALAENVTPALTNERLRRLGRWYEEQGQLDNAMDVLKQYRSLDPEMFDLDIDRVHKEQIRREDADPNNDSFDVGGQAG